MRDNTSSRGVCAVAVLIIALLACLLFLTVSCDDTPQGELEFTKRGESYTVSGIGTYTGDRVEIPETYQDLPVTAIGRNAFEGTHIKSIIIPSKVTGINACAFRNCSDLKTVICRSGSIDLIAEHAFDGTPYIEEGSNGDWSDGALYLGGCLVRVAPAKTGTLTVRAGTTTLAYQAFRDSRIERVIVPDGVWHGGKYTFYGCTALREVVYQGTVGYLSEGMFYGCTALTSFTVPGGCTSLGHNIFSGCTSLTTVTLPDELGRIDAGAFSGCKALTEIHLPEKLTSIGDEAFLGCTSLIAVTGTPSLRTIGAKAFRRCSALAAFPTLSADTVIGNFAFEGTPFEVPAQS